MSNQQFYIALAVPCFLILVGWMIKFQGYKMMAERFDELRSDFLETRRDVRAETETLAPLRTNTSSRSSSWRKISKS